MALDRASHARHDRFAIADSIGGGVLPGTTGTCPACGALHGDLLTLQRAIRDAWLPSRPRDLRLTVATALRLRRRTWRDRFALIASPLDQISKPLGLAFAALGLAGLLLTSLPGGTTFGSAGGAPEIGRQTSAAAGASTPPQPATPLPASMDQKVTEHVDVPASATGIWWLFVGLGGSILLVRRLAPRTRAVR